MEKLEDFLLQKSNFYLCEDYDEEIGCKVYQYLITGEIFKINYQTSYYSLIKEEINKNYLIDLAQKIIINQLGEKKLLELLFI
jgi:hypothetical protein